jgi:hypothetical protein
MAKFPQVRKACDNDVIYIYSGCLLTMTVGPRQANSHVVAVLLFCARSKIGCGLILRALVVTHALVPIHAFFNVLDHCAACQKTAILLKDFSNAQRLHVSIFKARLPNYDLVHLVPHHLPAHSVSERSLQDIRTADVEWIISSLQYFSRLHLSHHQATPTTTITILPILTIFSDPS